MIRCGGNIYKKKGKIVFLKTRPHAHVKGAVLHLGKGVHGVHER